MRALSVARVSLGIAAVIAALRLVAPAPLELLDLKLLDFRHVVRGALPAGGEVVIVGIDEASLDAIGRWPWPRSRLAELVDRLAGAKAIGFDVVMDQPDTTLDRGTLRDAVAAEPARPAAELFAALGPDHDAQLAAAFRRSGRVALGYYFELAGAHAPDLAAETGHLPELSVRAVGGATVAGVRGLEDATRAHVDVPALLTGAAGAGHINFLPDGDGLYRRVPVVVRVGDRVVPALALELLRLYLGGATAMLTIDPHGVSALRLGPLPIPVDAAGQLWIDYLGPPRTIASLRAADVLAGRVPADAVAGKIVLVGFTAAGFDEVATPFTAVAPGVELQATLIDDLLHGRMLRRPWWVVPAEAAAVLALGLLVGLALRRLHTVGGSLVAVGLALGWLAGTQLLFVREYLVIGALYPLAAVVFCTLGGAVFQSLTEAREKRWFREAFSHYLNPEVTELLAQDPSRLRLGGERRALTVLFSDVREFTSIAEALPPEALGELLNEYLGTMTDVVFRHEGLLDKYVGDAVMAFWGAPLDAPDHAARCCRAALDMIVALRALHVRWREGGLPLLEMRIGINTGEAVVGNFGSAQRFSYTAMGDDVNLASRLEGLNKEYGTTILVADATRRAIGDEFVCREMDRVRVKGRVQPVAVHELLGRRADDHDGTLVGRAAAFAAALAAYRERDWDEAIGRLVALGERWPDDPAVPSFLARCRRLRDRPPPPAWDGVFEALTK
jgi:adenylate cyclase